ncbi:MAG: hypothetical protein NT079_02395 [Candidatus Omnitrophica bacterium]|nr:hypothetical protein [Candidatus Omnitrophota bacterium]
MVKKTFFLVISLLFLCLIPRPAEAQEKKIITLKDGTKIVGEILSLQNNVYAVQSSVGPLQIKDQDIVNILAFDTATAPHLLNTNSAGTGEVPMSPKENSTAIEAGATPTVAQSISSINPAESQIANVQERLMGDQNFISEIKNVADDQEIMHVLSQPDIMKAVGSHDINALQSNPQFKNLLNNPKILHLIESAGQKLGQPNLKP